MLLKLFPCRAAIVRAIETAAGAAVRKRPRHATSLPERSENDIRILRIECDVDPAGVFIFIENLLPGLPAVNGAKDAALGIWTVRMAKRGDENAVRILGIYDQLADGARIAEPHVLPGLAAVNRFVNAVTMRGVAADAAFARSYIDDVWIGQRNRQAADG